VLLARVPQLQPRCCLQRNTPARAPFCLAFGHVGGCLSAHCTVQVTA
jgi:hypothetical protein